jgi:hypothetical protein
MPNDPKLGYFEAIQVYFLDVTGRGIMFSGRDLQLLCRWRAQGASAKMICRGIDEAVRSMDPDDPPRDIWACQAWIEAEIERAADLSTGAHQDGQPAGPAAAPKQEADEQPAGGEHSLLEEALDNIEQAGRDCDDERRRKVYRQAWRQVRELVEASAVEDPYAQLAAIEDALVDAYFGALDRTEQERIEEAIGEQNRADLALMSPEARQEHLAARRRRLLIRQYGLAPLID